MTTVGGIDMIATYVGCSCIYIYIYNGEDSVVGASFDGWMKGGMDTALNVLTMSYIYIYILFIYLYIYLYTGIYIYIYIYIY